MGNLTENYTDKIRDLLKVYKISGPSERSLPLNAPTESVFYYIFDPKRPSVPLLPPLSLSTDHPSTRHDSGSLLELKISFNRDE